MTTNLLAELRHACWRLVRTPVFTLSAVLTLGLGLGVNAALFSLANGVLLKPLPLPGLERVANVCRTEHGRARPDYGLTREQFRRLRELDLQLIESVAAVRSFVGVVSAGGGSQLIMIEAISGPYFRLWGVQPRLGRFLLPSDEHEGVPVIVVSERVWRNLLGADPQILGLTVRVSGRPVVVVGVTPAGFRGCSVPNLLGADAWVPLAFLESDRRWPALAFVRLRPGAPIRRADTELRVRAARIDPARPEFGLALVPARRALVPQPLRFYLTLAGVAMLALSGLVLLAAAGNVTHLLLARWTSRRGELAVRLALGASRADLVQHLAVETTLVGVLGGALGVVLALLTARGLTVIALPEIGGFVPRPDISPDWRVVGYAGLTTLLVATGLVAVLAKRVAQADAAVAGMRVSGTGSTTAADARSRALLLALQMACSTVLLVIAGLFVRSTAAAQAHQPRLETAHTAVARFDHRLHGYDQGRGQRVNRRLLEAARAAPAIERAALASGLPRAGEGAVVYLSVDEEASGLLGSGVGSRLLSISPGFFDVLGIPLVRGRDFTPRDVKGAEPVAILSETVARDLWPGQDPIGRRLQVSGRSPAGPWVRVVGLVGDAEAMVAHPIERRFVFVPIEQRYEPALVLLARGRAPAGVLASALPVAARVADPDLALYDTRPLAEELGLMVTGLRLAALVVSALAVLGSFVALVGVVGVTAEVVGERRREFAIRCALGATDADVYRMVAREVLQMLVLGVIPGVALAFAAGRTLRSFLFGVAPLDWLTFTAVPAGSCSPVW